MDFFFFLFFPFYFPPPTPYFLAALCGMWELAPSLGIEPAVELHGFSHWTTRKYEDSFSFF